MVVNPYSALFPGVFDVKSCSHEAAAFRGPCVLALIPHLKLASLISIATDRLMNHGYLSIFISLLTAQYFVLIQFSFIQTIWITLITCAIKFDILMSHIKKESKLNIR